MSNIKEAIKESAFTKEEIAEMLWLEKYNIDLVNKIVSENFSSEVETIIEIADICNVSTDYLLGLTNVKNRSWKPDKSHYR